MFALWSIRYRVQTPSLWSLELLQRWRRFNMMLLPKLKKRRKCANHTLMIRQTTKRAESTTDSASKRGLWQVQLFKIKNWSPLPALTHHQKKEPLSPARKIATASKCNSQARQEDHSSMKSWQRGYNSASCSWDSHSRLLRSSKKQWDWIKTRTVTRVHSILNNRATCPLLDFYRGKTSPEVKWVESPTNDRILPTDSALTMTMTKEALTINLHSMRETNSLTLLQRSSSQEKIWTTSTEFFCLHRRVEIF